MQISDCELLLLLCRKYKNKLLLFKNIMQSKQPEVTHQF